MTTLNNYRAMDHILQQLAAVRMRRWWLKVLTALLTVAAVVPGGVCIVAVLAGYWPGQPPPAVRWMLLAAVCLLWAVALGRVLKRLLFTRQNPAQTARLVEEAMPSLRNDLINSVLLSRDRDQPSPELVHAAICEADLRAERADLNKSLSLKPLKRWSLAAGISALLLAAMATFQPAACKRGLLAVFAPRSFVPTFGTVRLLHIAPGETRIFAGQPVTVVAKIENERGEPLRAEVVIDGRTPRPMLAGGGNTTFRCPLGPVHQTLRYAVLIGDSRWPAEKAFYQITALKRVELEGLDLKYEYPPYTAMETRTVRNASGEIEAPIGSRVILTLRVSAAVPAVIAEFDRGSPVRMKASPDNRSFWTAITVLDDGAYRLVMKDADGATLQQFPDAAAASGRLETYSAAGRAIMKGTYRIHAIPDSPPRIKFVAPNRDVTAAPGGAVETRIRLRDDHAVATSQFFIGPEGQPPAEAGDFKPPRGVKLAEFDYRIHVPEQSSEGDVLFYHATAVDNRNLPTIGGPQTSQSSKFKITVQDAAKVAAESAERYEHIRRKLLAILEMQNSERVNTLICRHKHTTCSQVVVTAGRILAGQRKIKAELADLADDARGLFDRSTVSIQQAVALLANNEARLAVDQAQVLAALKDLSGRRNATALLGKTQDKIIEVLQTLLVCLPSAAGGQRRTETVGGDLPNDVRDRLTSLRQNLDKFIDSQKKLVQASQRLAKKPVDAFTPEDIKLLHELQAAQDKWEKFLNEQFTDFSKLARQDFSNPVLMKELISVKSDITMAKDALKKEAIEIATAFEDNGIENAKTLTANIEKWLPDEPDRRKWQMEDLAAGQENIEQAELPSELEDLVGDLLEQEEDLFERADDITSQYAGSFDKGAGWDAMDGPISSMNAQGVTGNQLPNTNEMSGRSGEGRTGKSSGEYVEDKAVGKGGRRTPTRLTPEPFSRGQVKDFSKEPPGGATGGGKISGAGAEGLEGPLPPPLARELKRLAGQQAVLVNRAERIQAAFKTNDYANFKFLQAIMLMNRVRSDLENYRYKNVRRARKETVAALKQTRLLLAGKIDVAADSSSALPKQLRDDIADAMGGKLPTEYRHVLQQYYRRLSEEAGR
ncbi:MAG: hypothetical protein SVT52_08370 [Planctomycetota bacterium]|nr:hypothetical protein [Planctomycetota bacterium]